MSDLFGEESYFANPDTFWSLQNQAIAKPSKPALKPMAGLVWKFLEQGQRFNEWDYEKTAKKKGGAVFIAVSDRGEVEAHEGYFTRAEIRKAEAKNTGTTDKSASQIRKARTD